MGSTAGSGGLALADIESWVHDIPRHPFIDGQSVISWGSKGEHTYAR